MSWIPPTANLDATPRVALPEGRRMGAMEVICARHGLPTRGLALFASGSDVVFGGDGFVIKLSTPRWAGQIAHERRVLGMVEGALPVETPRVVAHGDVAGWPYVVMHRLEGMRSLASVWGGLHGKARRRLAGELGEVVAALHALPVSDADAGEWAGWLAVQQAAVVERHGGAVPAGWGSIEGFVGGGRAAGGGAGLVAYGAVGGACVGAGWAGGGVDRFCGRTGGAPGL